MMKGKPMKAQWRRWAAGAVVLLALNQADRAGFIPAPANDPDVGEAGLDGKPQSLGTAPWAGDVVLMEMGDPAKAADQNNKDNWSDVVRFLQVLDNSGKVTNVTVQMISSNSDGTDLTNDLGFGKITLQQGNMGKTIAPPVYILETASVLKYTPQFNQPGFESMDPKKQRTYTLASDVSEALPAPSSLALALLGAPLLAGYARRRGKAAAA
jgi:hypothetical protein